MRRLLTALVLLGFVSLLYTLPSTVFAQEEEEDYSWGKISKVTSNEIIVNEYDYSQDKDIEVSYVVDSKIKLEGVKSLQDIKPGDDVEIDYVIKDGKKVARIVAISREPEEEGEEEEYSPSETDEEEPEYPSDEEVY